MQSRVKQLLLTCACALSVIGCANQTSTTDGSSAELQRQTQLVQEKQTRISALESELSRARAMQASSASTTSAPAPMDSSLFPPNPKPGECYARVIAPATFKTITETVLKREAGESVSIVPAVYEPGTERVVTREASTRLEVVPATYKTVTERVLVKPESRRLVEVPATYETVTERVLNTPARTEWKRGTGIATGNIVSGLGGAAAQVARFGGEVVETKVVEDTGELMCLVEIPATYKTLSKQVIASPAGVREIVEPAVYKTVERTVLDRPATTRQISIPAEYDTVKVTRLVNPARESRTTIPAEYETLTQKVKVTDAEIIWRPVLCEVNMTKENVVAMQSSLRSAESGCWTCGTVDGVMGPCTLKATQCYARKRGLSSGDKYVTLEVVRSLGLNL